MIEPDHKKLSIRKQARLLGVIRNGLKKKPHPPRADLASDQEVLVVLDRLHTRWLFYWQRKLKVELDKLGLLVIPWQVSAQLRPCTSGLKTCKPSPESCPQEPAAPTSFQQAHSRPGTL